MSGSPLKLSRETQKQKKGATGEKRHKTEGECKSDVQEASSHTLGVGAHVPGSLAGETSVWLLDVGDGSDGSRSNYIR